MAVGVYRAVENHILRMLADGEMPYKALRKAVERDLGISKVAVCRTVKRLIDTGQIERIIPEKGKRLQILRIGTGMLKRTALMEMAKRARAEQPERVPQVRVEREQPPAVRAVPSDPLGRWWLQGPSA